ncbi:hypothetical protein HYPSUDRAFT_54815 [Hypholoma sublateritium FD-334 SS-4]|uniref:Uncharacterized protein n=1 Tax=Hypholoma sublateritium (strain FD-334 SS-4) TaxID=945553 RepID=A0A0D2PSL6_HYPSF|nr:hypothetical protein HYPSUDRAFT_54815 [Hypholoma sublateritium FD-334 SS-4]
MRVGILTQRGRNYAWRAEAHAHTNAGTGHASERASGACARIGCAIADARHALSGSCALALASQTIRASAPPGLGSRKGQCAHVGRERATSRGVDGKKIAGGLAECVRTRARHAAQRAPRIQRNLPCPGGVRQRAAGIYRDEGCLDGPGHARPASVL